MKSVELRATKASVIAEYKAVVDAADSDKRDLTPEEETRTANMRERIDELASEIARCERREYVEGQEAELRVSTGRKSSPVSTANRREVSAEERSEQFRVWALTGCTGYKTSPEVAARAAETGFDVYGSVLEYRALSKASGSVGAYTVPTSFATTYDKALGYYFGVGSVAGQLITADGRDYQYPTVSDTSNTAGIVSEASGIGVATDPTFGQVTFKSWDYFSPNVKVSAQLLRDSAVEVPSLLADLFAERMGRAFDAAVVSANAGSSAPEGILYGVTAGVNLLDGNALTVAKLLALETSVDRAYRAVPGCGWLMHDATWQAVRSLADSTGRPLVNIDLQEGVSPRLLGYPVHISNQMTAITSPGDNAPLILFGAMSKYLWRTVGNSSLQRLNELYAGNGQVGFVLHEAHDGRYVTKAGVRTLNSFDAS